MKKIKLYVSALLMLGSAFTTHGQTLDEILQKHLNAIGGLDNIKKINTVKMTGSMNMGGQEIGVVMTCVNNKAIRQDITVAGMANYVIITTTNGWAYFPMSGQTKPEAMTDDQVKQSATQLDMQGPLVDYQAKGTKVEYIGKDDVEGTECYKLKIVYKNGLEETYYIDASNFYHIRSVQKMKVNGKEEEAIVNYSNYQKTTDGITMPMTIGSAMGDVTFKTIEINKPVDESLFKVAN